MLLILGGIMALSSFLAGILPLSVSLSQRQLRIMTAVGSGLLVGTALVIIIPEGIEALYSDTKHEQAGHATKGHPTSHSVIGITLVLGFSLMYLIDVLPPLLSSKSSSNGHIPLSTADLSSEPPTPFKPPPAHSHAHATTIGLVAASSTPSVGLVVFVAIMLHKAPAAFGLTTALLKQGLNKRAARTHLLLFSLAAPMGALVTWAVVGALAGWGLDGESGFWTGVALVFSGGTFLLVAMWCFTLFD